MKTRTIALYATDTMADWEYAHLTTQIARAEEACPGRFSLLWVGDGLDPVVSLGGLSVQPDADLAAIEEDDSLAALVIPGGDHYNAGHDRLATVMPTLLERGVAVAAICGATLLTARAGLLDQRRHTSNDPAFLEFSGYAGGDNYVVAPVVTDQGLTTAAGVHPVAFTAEVMRIIGLVDDAVVTAWEKLYTTGEAQHFYDLMEATRAWQNTCR